MKNKDINSCVYALIQLNGKKYQNTMKRNTEYNKKKYQMQWREASKVMEWNIKSTEIHYKITDNSHLSFRYFVIYSLDTPSWGTLI